MVRLETLTKQIVQRCSWSDGRPVRPGPSEARPASSLKPAANTPPNLFLQGCLKRKVCRRKISPIGPEPVERNRVVAPSKQAGRQGNSNRVGSRRRNAFSRPDHVPRSVTNPRTIAPERRILFKLQRKRNQRRRRGDRNPVRRS